MGVIRWRTLSLSVSLSTPPSLYPLILLFPPSPLLSVDTQSLTHYHTHIKQKQRSEATPSIPPSLELFVSLQAWIFNLDIPIPTSLVLQVPLQVSNYLKILWVQTAINPQLHQQVTVTVTVIEADLHPSTLLLLPLQSILMNLLQLRLLQAQLLQM